jgi:hypothetical protein
MNPRIETLAPGVTREVISLTTTMVYDPASNGVQITFGGRPCIFVGDDYKGPGGDQAPLLTSLDTIAARCFGSGVDPVTNFDLSKVSAAGAALIIKAAFATLYDEAQDVPRPVADVVNIPQPGVDDA